METTKGRSQEWSLGDETESRKGCGVWVYLCVGEVCLVYVCVGVYVGVCCVWMWCVCVWGVVCGCVWQCVVCLM